MAPLREATAKRLGTETHAIMLNAIRQLRASGMMDRVIKPPTRAPDFTLNDQNGVPVAMAGMLATGPAVLSVFRGFW